MVKCKSFWLGEVEHFVFCVHLQKKMLFLWDQIKDGFEMENVDIVTLKALYERLVVDGEVSKSRGYYEERMGLTQTPITSFNVHTFMHSLGVWTIV